MVLSYRDLHYLSQKLDLKLPKLDDLLPACEETLHNEIVINYSKTTKSNAKIKRIPTSMKLDGYSLELCQKHEDK